MTQPNFTRRGFLGASAGAAGALAAAPRLGRAAEPAGPSGPVRTPDMVDIVLEVNGTRHKLAVEPRVTLLDALRERLHLYGTKKGCDRGACGACTVHVDGRRVVSCLTLAARCQGKAVATIEGLANGDAELHPMQAAFLDHDGFQCGYCTPGQIMSAVALVAEGRPLTDAAIREWMSGNICRCGAYPNIRAAIKDAARRA
ncbi:MAG TPA: (2Fe-2S)-binding protein [Stellaceae bacterium]|jgi:xanthine dehydrogenase YagT iron-sulfur-binding subunit